MIRIFVALVQRRIGATLVITIITILKIPKVAREKAKVARAAVVVTTITVDVVTIMVVAVMGIEVGDGTMVGGSVITTEEIGNWPKRLVVRLMLSISRGQNNVSLRLPVPPFAGLKVSLVGLFASSMLYS